MFLFVEQVRRLTCRCIIKFELLHLACKFAVNQLLYALQALACMLIFQFCFTHMNLSLISGKNAELVLGFRFLVVLNYFSYIIYIHVIYLTLDF